MLVSVIVATFNRPALLESALKSISLQTAAQFEVVVVNDGGVDVSESVARWGRLMPVQYIHLPVNVGLARARNAALRGSSGDIICFLDDDDIMLTGHLRIGTEQLSSGDVDAICTQVAVCDEFVAAGAVPTASQVKAHYKAGFDSRLLLACNFMPVNAVFIRRRAEVPILFDEQLQQLEDWELWLRLHNHFGYRFRAVPHTTAVYHRVPGFSSMTNSSKGSADEATRFRDTFRQIVSRYPSNDALVRQARALHDDFYTAVVQASLSGKRNLTFSYEHFIDCVAAFIGQKLDAEAVRKRIDALLHA
jgi:O-antigen biosynthesis protein